MLDTPLSSLPQDPLGNITLRKVTRRLIPFMAVLYFINYLDRVNVGFAALTMNGDLGFSATVYGNAAGILFLGYVLFQVPSNLALERFGPRRWVMIIMVAWGSIASAMAFVTGPVSYYVLRFLLGAAEAGFFPGMILYLTYWFPYSRRARITAAFMLAVPISSLIGGPLSTVFLGVNDLGLKGWQWLFLLQGIPAVVLAVLAVFVLTDRPAKARWLDASQKAWLQNAIDRDVHRELGATKSSIVDVLRNARIWMFGLIYFGNAIALYGLGLWMPQIIKSFGGLSNLQVGLLTTVPYGFGAISMYFWCAHSDETRERRWHAALAFFLGALGLAVSALSVQSPAVAFIGLIVASMGIYAGLPTFWSLPTAALSPATAAAGIAIVNAVGNVGGYAGPVIVGYFRDRTHSYTAGLLCLASLILLSGLLSLMFGPRPQSHR